MAYVGEYNPRGLCPPQEQRRSRKLRLSPLTLSEHIYREKLARLTGWPCYTKRVTNSPLHANATLSSSFHYNQPGHSITDIELIPLELQPTLSMSRRKAREAHKQRQNSFTRRYKPQGRTFNWILSITLLYEYLPIASYHAIYCSNFYFILG